MKKPEHELILGGLGQLWALSKKCEDYWRDVASFEWEDSLCFFKTLSAHPEQIEIIFGKVTQETHDKIKNHVDQLAKKNRGYIPGFFETCLWAALIEIRSTVLRKEWIELALNLDAGARRLIGAAEGIRAKELEEFLSNSRRWNTLAKHVHPAFDKSSEILPAVVRKTAA